ncbi:ATP-binding protein [Pseudoxanthomonas winnipegensis]|uniref:ATP-binding protein n=1 Tax=Pseudoxanthomonas winnipegensis TaxID=2480810 RepID=UPI003CCFEFE9
MRVGHRGRPGFGFIASPVDRSRVERLHQGDFIRTAENLALVGGTGIGKTHLATPLGIQTVAGIACACALLPPSNGSTPWRRNRLKAGRGRSSPRLAPCRSGHPRRPGLSSVDLVCQRRC